MTAHQILIIDDDVELTQRLTQYFSRFDLELKTAADPIKGLEMIHQKSPSLIILDLMLPGIDGFEVCRRIRQHFEIPILMLTARNELIDKVVGLELGADDYLLKPFEPRELIARVKNLIRRYEQFSDQLHSVSNESLGRIRIDRTQQQAYVDDKSCALTTTEFRILSLLTAQAGKPVSRVQVLETIRGDGRLDSRAVDVMISKLRQKLLPLSCIKTVRNVGYQFTIPEDQKQIDDSK